MPETHQNQGRIATYLNKPHFPPEWRAQIKVPIATPHSTTSQNAAPRSSSSSSGCLIEVYESLSLLPVAPIVHHDRVSCTCPDDEDDPTLVRAYIERLYEDAITSDGGGLADDNVSLATLEKLIHELCEDFDEILRGRGKGERFEVPECVPDPRAGI